MLCIVLVMPLWRINNHTHTHTHTPVQRPFVRDYPSKPVPERYNQSGFYWSRRQRVAVVSAGPYMQVCTSLETDNHASTSLISFLQAGCPSCRPTNSVKALKALWRINLIIFRGFCQRQSSVVANSTNTTDATQRDGLVASGGVVGVN